MTTLPTRRPIIIFLSLTVCYLCVVSGSDSDSTTNGVNDSTDSVGAASTPTFDTNGAKNSDVKTDSSGDGAATLPFHSNDDDDEADELFPPLITRPEGPYQKIILKGMPETLQCQAEGNPPPTFEWFKNGVRMTSEHRDIKAFPNGTLIARKFLSDYNGYFQCRASNSLGTSMSDIVHILAELYPSGNPVDTVFTVKDGESFDLKCDGIRETVPKMEKRWYVGKNNELKLNERRGVDSEGTLHFAYVEKNEDSGLYTCGLVPQSGVKNSINLFKRGEIEFSTGDDIPTANSRPSLLYSRDKIKAVIGKSVVLECFFASKPVAKIRWMNASNHQVTNVNPRYEIFDFGRKLRVHKVIQQDEGVFTCIGTNDLGYQESQIRVNVTSPPMLVSGGVLKSQIVPDQRDLTLKCKSMASTNEHVNKPLWYRNGELLGQRNVPDPARYKFSSDHTELLIQDLDKPVDTACFQCNSTNSEGYLFFDAYVKVINSIVVTKRPADHIEINTVNGSVADLTILTTGDLCCPINHLWYFNDSLINPTTWPAFQTNPDTGALQFNSLLVNKEMLLDYTGTYTCRVSNVYQFIDVNIVITPKESLSEPVTAAKATVGLWWIGLVCGIVAIIATVVIVVIIYKSNYPGSTYKLEEQEIKHNLNPEEDLMNQSFQEI